MTDTTPVEALAAFDKAVADELPLVSCVPYNSQEICKWFASNVRARLASLAVSPEPNCARVELVVALQTLASHYENSLGGFGDDDEGLRKAQGDIVHAMKVAAKHNQNGPSCHPVSAVPPLSDAASDESLGAPASPSGSAGSAPSPSVSAFGSDPWREPRLHADR